MVSWSVLEVSSVLFSGGAVQYCLVRPNPEGVCVTCIADCAYTYSLVLGTPLAKGSPRIPSDSGGEGRFKRQGGPSEVHDNHEPSGEDSRLSDRQDPDRQREGAGQLQPLSDSLPPR